MIYFLPSAITKKKYKSNFGFIVTATKSPSGSAIKRIKQGRKWICDNGAFTGAFDENLFFPFLKKMKPYQEQCLFVVAPDVVGDPRLTLQNFLKYSPQIKELGYRVAFVAQDGQEDMPYPAVLDALFIGGSIGWKHSEGAERCIKYARKEGIPVHVGRVNTFQWIKYFSMLGVDSVDGTHTVFAPDRGTKELERWIDQASQPLFYF